jgi:hypothetical protein
MRPRAHYDAPRTGAVHGLTEISYDADAAEQD